MSYGIREKFYKSKLWQKVKKNVWIKQCCLCNRCHRPVYVDGISDYIPKEKRRTGIVHHKIYLNDININDPSIALCMDNLEGLCKECHELEHHKDEVTRKGYMFDEDGDLVER